MPPKLDSVLKYALSDLQETLGDNLYSCCLYGSAVRGNYVDKVSDINLLIVLNQSDTAAHLAVANAIGRERKIDPFILGRPGFSRSVRAFASKFASIKRNYKVLHGVDPLADVKVDADIERFLCEQGLRNTRLRLVYGFVRREQTRVYHLFLMRMATPVLVQLSEILRVNGVPVPKEMDARIPVLEKELGIDGQVLRDLIAFKQDPRRLSDREAIAWHERVFTVVDKAVRVVEAKWTA